MPCIGLHLALAESTTSQPCMRARKAAELISSTLHAYTEVGKYSVPEYIVYENIPRFICSHVRTANAAEGISTAHGAARSHAAQDTTKAQAGPHIIAPDSEHNALQQQAWLHFVRRSELQACLHECMHTCWKLDNERMKATLCFAQ
eukprot:313930-Pelagomonas_calceolata.AAC.10